MFRAVLSYKFVFAEVFFGSEISCMQNVTNQRQTCCYFQPVRPQQNDLVEICMTHNFPRLTRVTNLCDNIWLVHSVFLCFIWLDRWDYYFWLARISRHHQTFFFRFRLMRLLAKSSRLLSFRIYTPKLELKLPVSSKTGIRKGWASYPRLTHCCNSSIVFTLVVSSGRLSSATFSASNRESTSFLPADFIL